jgi:hypothetical protein
MRGVKHSSDDVLAAVIKANKIGADLRTGAVQRGPYRWCYRSAGYYWTNWKEVLREAGIKYVTLQERVREHKRREFKTKLRDAYNDGIDLSASGIQNSGCRTFYEMAKTLFASEGQFFLGKSSQSCRLTG